MFKKFTQIIAVGLILLLSACNHDDNSNASFSISNVSVDTELKTGSPATLSFSLMSDQNMDDLILSMFITSTSDATQRFNVHSKKLSQADKQAVITSIFNVPESVTSGAYQISVNITSNDLQSTLTVNETLMVALVEIVTPSQPELTIEKYSLTNNSFVLPVKPNDNVAELTSAGDFELNVVMRSKYAVLTDNIELSFSLELDGLGDFPLVTTSHVTVTEPNSTTHHRDINKLGKVVTRIKGQSRVIPSTCKHKNDTESCYVIDKNGRKQIHADLHINQATYEALEQHASDINGSIVINISTAADLVQTEYRLPIIYLHQSAVVAQTQQKTLYGKSSSGDTSDVNVEETTSSGDTEYLHQTIKGQANTFQNSEGHANSTQSQDITIILDGHSDALATISTSVTTGDNDDINNTSLGITLSAMGGTVFDFVDSINNASAKSAPYTTKKQQKDSSSAKTDSSTSYNPQDEMQWVYCAEQRDKCWVDDKGLPGTTQVRYGDTDSNRWNHRQVTSYATCDDDHFGGDPAKGVNKHCEFLITPSYAPQWARCAPENDTCYIDKASTVRYGRDANWITNEFTGDFICNNETQGGDPYSGQDKVCEIMVDAGAPPLDYEYEYCGEEGEDCVFDGSAVVRFSYTDDSTGAIFSIYVSKRGPVYCNSGNEYFGDPLIGKREHCEYLKYIDPNTRHEQTDLTWSTKNVEKPGDFTESNVSEAIGEEKILVEVEYSKEKDMRTYWGFVFNAKISVHGEVGLKLNGYIDNSLKSFSLVGGPYIGIDSEASGSASDVLGVTDVGIYAPIQLLDLYSPFTVTFTVRPKVLTAEISLDYFLDLIYGEVIVYYDYSYTDIITGITWKDHDEEEIYSWSPLYQTTGNLFQGSKSWDISPVTNYILPAVQDAYFKAKIGFEVMEAAREYSLEIRGTLTNNEIWDAANPNEYVTVDVVCADEIIQSTTFTGEIDEVIPLLECATIDISGIRAAVFSQGNLLTFGVREK